MRALCFVRPRARRAAAPWVLATIVAVASGGPPDASADGGIVHPFAQEVREPSQKAMILYDGHTQTEDLLLQVEFHGETKDFGWIVPVPALPTLETAEPLLFWDCAQLTRPIRRDRGTGWGCLDNDGIRYSPGDARPGEDDVQVYEEQIVGIYRTVTLGADDSAALADSLEAWGYLHDANREVVEQALDFYIAKSWYFVAMKMDSASAGGWYEDGFWHGFIDPIRLSFESADVVYPMRISAISAQDPSEVLLYVCAPHRMTFDGARTEYANRFGEAEFAHIREHYGYLAAVLDEPCFMTKLRKTFSIGEMSADVVLEQAERDVEFREIDYTGIPSTELLLFASAGFLATRAWRRRRRCASPAR